MSGSVTCTKLPGRGPVDGGGLVEVLGDRLETGQQRDREERRAAPDVDGDDRAHRQCRIAEERDVAADEPVLEHPGDDPVGRVENPEPGQRRARRDDPGQEQRRALGFLKRKCWFISRARAMPSTSLNTVSDARVDERVPQRLLEDAVLGVGDEVVQADERLGTPIRALIRLYQIPSRNGRDEDGEDDDGRAIRIRPRLPSRSKRSFSRPARQGV